MRRPRDWFRQAERHLEVARLARDHARFESACSAAHQAAEKAVHEALGIRGLGPLRGRAPREPAEVPDAVVEAAKGLDKLRFGAYPNAHPGGASGELHTDARRALDDAGTVIEYARRRLP